MSALLEDMSVLLSLGTRWWLSELASFIPAGLKRQPGQRPPDVIVSAAADGSARIVADGTRPRGGKLSGPDVWDFLGQLGQSRPGTKVGLRLPFSACYLRRLEIPASARHQAGSILALDLERATPFKANDVLTSHYLEPSPARKGWLNACQLIAKRATAAKWIADIEALGLKVARIDCWAQDGKSPIPIDFLSTPATGSGPRAAGRKSRLLFAILAVALALSATAVAISRHEAALQTLETQVAAARADATIGRQKRDEIEMAASQTAAMRAFRLGRPATVDIIEEVSRLLPDAVSLTDLKIDSNTIDLSGFAKSAADVIPIFERSQMFKDATLTAPVTFDGTENKEHFSLRAKFRKAPALVPAKPDEAVP